VLKEDACPLGENENDYKVQYFRDYLLGDFVPVKVGQRIVETVKFTVQLNCNAKELNLDECSKQIIRQPNFDYESVPVLKKFKIESLR